VFNKLSGKNELEEIKICEQVTGVYFSVMTKMEVDLRETQSNTTKHPISRPKIGSVSTTKDKGMSVIVLNLNVSGSRNRTVRRHDIQNRQSNNTSWALTLSLNLVLSQTKSQH
jgi:hypothetical protein